MNREKAREREKEGWRSIKTAKERKRETEGKIDKEAE